MIHDTFRTYDALTNAIANRKVVPGDIVSWKYDPRASKVTQQRICSVQFYGRMLFSYTCTPLAVFKPKAV